MRRWGRVVVLVWAAIAPGVGASDAATAVTAVTPARDAAAFQAVMLAGHNAARGSVGLNPLRWDDRLAAAAGSHAAAMARTGEFAHSPGVGGSGQGENLWMGTRGGYAYAEMVDRWVAERRDFVDAPTPAFSRTGQWQDVGHFTQIMWRGTTHVGCALASGRADDFLVCRYSPAGNVMGQRPY